MNQIFQTSICVRWTGFFRQKLMLVQFVFQSSQENQMIPKTRRVSKAKKVISEKQTKRRYQREELIDIAKRDGERCGYCWKSPSFDLLTTDLIDILEAGLRLENVAKEPLNVTTQEFKEYQEPRKEPFVDYLYQV